MKSYKLCNRRLLFYFVYVASQCVVGQKRNNKQTFPQAIYNVNHEQTKLKMLAKANIRVTKPGKVKSAYEPRGPSGRSLSLFLWQEATESISTPSWMGC